MITCICEHSKYLKSNVDDSVIVCDKVLSVTDSSNVTNAILTNVTSFDSINFDDKKSKI